MPTTYLYASTAIDVPVHLAMAQLGPADVPAQLALTTLPAVSGASLQFGDLRRLLANDVFNLDIPLSLVRPQGDQYLASLQFLLRGTGLESRLFFRWRTAEVTGGRWITEHDRQPHEITCPQGDQRYLLTLESVGTWGYDDVKITLGMA